MFQRLCLHAKYVRTLIRLPFAWTLICWAHCKYGDEGNQTVSSLSAGDAEFGKIDLICWMCHPVSHSTMNNAYKYKYVGGHIPFGVSTTKELITWNDVAPMCWHLNFSSFLFFFWRLLVRIEANSFIFSRIAQFSQCSMRNCKLGFLSYPRCCLFRKSQMFGVMERNVDKQQQLRMETFTIDIAALRATDSRAFFK